MMRKKQLILCLALLEAFIITQAADVGPLDTFERDVVEQDYLDTSEREVEQPEAMDLDDQNAAKCLKGWVQRGSYCYFRTSTRKDFSNTEKYCASLHAGAHLASVSSKQEYDFIKNTFGTGKSEDSFWIGLKDVKQGIKPRQWTWTDGSAYNYHNWHPKQPDDYRRQEDCVRMHRNEGYQWSDCVCWLIINGICKHRASANLPKCAKGWVQHGDHCYFRTSFTDKFFNMDKRCSSLHKGAHLASVHSQKDQDFIKKTFGTQQSGYGFWIGLHDAKKGAKPRKWTWTDKSAYKYSNWTPKQPNDYKGQENCVYMRRKSTFRWNDITCWTKMKGLCSYSLQ